MTFPDGYLTAACRTTVLNTVSVNCDVILHLGKSGSAVAEIDTLTRGTITYSAPATGKSVSSVIDGISHATYPEGIAPGNAAPTTISGVNMASLTGVAPPGRGSLVVDATIVLVDDGVPITAFDTPDIVAASGNFTRATDESCAALT